jgi:peptidoglycan/xylan/chitin deacetylase (PgdA/CDA1 family)
MYHSVNSEPDQYSLTPTRLRQHLELVRRHYSIIRLKNLPSRSAVAARSVIVTFDDAFTDFRDHAYPILAELGVPATLFVPTGYIGRSNLWDAHLTDVKPKPIMDVHGLRSVTADDLVDLGSHSVEHVRMRRVSHHAMRSQAENSKKWLEDTFGNPITLFSYPYGQRDDFSSHTGKVLAEAGYQAAVTTCWGTRNSRRNLLALRRIHLGDRDNPSTVRAKIEGWYDWIGLKEQIGFVSRLARGRIQQETDS